MNAIKIYLTEQRFNYSDNYMINKNNYSVYISSNWCKTKYIRYIKTMKNSSMKVIFYELQKWKWLNEM